MVALAYSLISVTHVTQLAVLGHGVADRQQRGRGGVRRGQAMDRVAITVYQSAVGNGILGWLTNSVDRLVSALGNAIYFPSPAPVVILGAIWLAWHGLIRKRATRTIEGTLWMVLACAAAGLADRASGRLHRVRLAVVC